MEFRKSGFRPEVSTLNRFANPVMVGSDYGGWKVIPDLIHSESIVYSFGLGKDVSFDLGMIKNFGLTVHGFDPTPMSADWIRTQDFPSSFVFHELGIAGSNGSIDLFEPAREGFVSHSLVEQHEGQRSISVPVQRLSTIMNELNHTRVDILKMDIEGCEYDVLEDILKSDILPVQLLVEFHHKVLDMGLPVTQKAYAALKKAGYRTFFVSDNGNEFCFIRIATTVSTDAS